MTEKKVKAELQVSEERVSEVNGVFATLGLCSQLSTTTTTVKVQVDFNNPFEKFSLLKSEGYVFKLSGSTNS